MPERGRRRPEPEVRHAVPPLHAHVFGGLRLQSGSRGPKDSGCDRGSERTHHRPLSEFDLANQLELDPGAGPFPGFAPGTGAFTNQTFEAKFSRAADRRCFARSIDSSSMFKSVFLLISPIARSKALCLKFARSNKGASRINLPSASLTDSNPRTFRISSTETRGFQRFSLLKSRIAYYSWKSVQEVPSAIFRDTAQTA